MRLRILEISLMPAIRRECYAGYLTSLRRHVGLLTGGYVERPHVPEDTRTLLKYGIVLCLSVSLVITWKASKF